MSNEDTPGPPPGWYPTEQGQRYWDGTQWTEHVAVPESSGSSPSATGPRSFMASTSDQQMAMFAHLGQLLGYVTGIGGFIVPLVIMLTRGNESPFVRRAAVESLNFWITGFIAAVVSAVLILVLVGLLLLLVVAVVWFVLPIMAGLAANRGEEYRYPFSIRIIS